jgi:hypothetical protein
LLPLRLSFIALAVYFFFLCPGVIRAYIFSSVSLLVTHKQKPAVGRFLFLLTFGAPRAANQQQLPPPPTDTRESNSRHSVGSMETVLFSFIKAVAAAAAAAAKWPAKLMYYWDPDLKFIAVLESLSLLCMRIAWLSEMQSARLIFTCADKIFPWSLSRTRGCVIYIAFQSCFVTFFLTNEDRFLYALSNKRMQSYLDSHLIALHFLS